MRRVSAPSRPRPAVLSTLIYRSRASEQLTAADLSRIVKAARARNEGRWVTGILLFDGEYFLQMLEGPDEAVQALYERIAADARHVQVVRLLQDYAPLRRFPECGMRMVDIREHPEGLMDASLAGGLLRGADPLADDRPFKLMQAFVAGGWRGQAAEVSLPAHWRLGTRPSPFLQAADAGPAIASACRFALQPVINTRLGRVSSLEALIRTPEGGSPQEVLAGRAPDELHRFDLASKTHALDLASRVGLGSCKLAINLLPMALVSVPDAVDRLVADIDRRGLRPHQVVVEITENEAISHFHAFSEALKRLRAAGISIAIDDFGAGFAGLSLLSKFQPDKLKIDRQIVSGIHRDGPRQAIVRAIVDCCRSLGIAVVAEGVEVIEEWCWLQAAGIDLFQGFLFAPPRLDGVPDIQWPLSTRTGPETSTGVLRWPDAAATVPA